MLKTTDAIGHHVAAIIGRGKDWTNTKGETMPGFKVRRVEEWTDGKRLITDDLPF